MSDTPRTDAAVAEALETSMEGTDFKGAIADAVSWVASESRNLERELAHAVMLKGAVIAVTDDETTWTPCGMEIKRLEAELAEAQSTNAFLAQRCVEHSKVEARVHLIAAAPEMLAALKGLFGASQNEMVSRDLPLEWGKNSAMGCAEAAIAKAEGVEPTVKAKERT